MRKRVFVIHGWDGFPEEGWRPWLKKELETRSWEVVIPLMPDTKTPTVEKWVAHLARIVGKPSRQCYFLGHSLGCITILRYLETLPETVEVGGVIFFAGFGKDLTYEGYNHELASFFLKSLNWEKIKRIGNKFVAIHSDDDQWVEARNLDLFKEKLNAQTQLVHGFKHFSGDDGIAKLPLARDLLLKLAQ